tara:strand:- start:371 stop:625 length:255 start_codon:yes stop_codon:yes gene_type:complete
MADIKKYGETDSDKWVKEMSSSREIVYEILKHGVSQSQINQIIGLLALELENRDLLKGYRNVYKVSQGEAVEGVQSTSKIILDS